MSLHKVSSGDVEIEYEQFGSGPDLLLLHPFPAHRGIWKPAAATLANRFRVILPNLRGHGGSAPGEGPATMGKHAQDIRRVCEDAGVGRALFGGISIGGYVLFEFWRQFRERVAGLILSDTRAQADTPEGRANRLRAADDVLKRGTGPFIQEMLPKLLGSSTHRNRPDLVESARKMMDTATPAGIAAVQRGMAERPDSVPTLPAIQCPVLILVGGEDTLTPVADAEMMNGLIPNSQIRIIPQAGHYSPYERPEECASQIQAFLNGISNRA